jgi:WhiB family redox-sensing transcriptional regulator
MNLETSEPDARHTNDRHLENLPRCADSDGALSPLFFSNNDIQIDESKAICTTCGVQQSCLDGAIERAEPHGVWGGQLIRNGIPVARRPRRGRPPKTTNPPLTGRTAASRQP